METSGNSVIQRWLQSYCEKSTQIAGGIVAITVDRHLQNAAEWPLNSVLTPSLGHTAQAAIERAQPLIVVPAVTPQNALHTQVISLPLMASTRMLGAVALAINAADSSVVQEMLQNLERASSALISVLTSMGSPTQPVNAESLLKLQAELFRSASFEDSASALTSNLAVMLGFDRVSIGLQEHEKVRVKALSHHAEFKKHQELLQMLAAAMEEAIDQQASILCPASLDNKPRIILAHNELSRRTGMAICSVPLIHQQQVFGAIAFERSKNTPISADDIARCESIASLLGPVIQLKYRADLPWSTRTYETLKQNWDKCTKSGLTRLRVMTSSLLLLGLLGLMFPVTYRVGAPVRIEGAEQRVVAAPMDGFISKTHAKAGDFVHAGDQLIEMARQDLTLESRKWESALAQHENAYGAALARNDRVQFVINQAKATEARAQLDLIRQQLARTQIMAPIDGIIIKGDLSQSLGAPIQRGEVLMLLAPKNEFRLIIEVDERDIANVQTGQSGHLALSALPLETLAMTVERITPMATNKQGRNLFEVEARLNSSDTSLRPGLLGVAKIDVGKRSIAWIISHRITDWLRLATWSWRG